MSGPQTEKLIDRSELFEGQRRTWLLVTDHS